ncbi:MAG: hypothetical protein JSS66_18725 [Armatimonadetes bacterium]|nr:hypothetical protein [Armatimonadota bacterium]
MAGFEHLVRPGLWLFALAVGGRVQQSEMDAMRASGAPLEQRKEALQRLVKFQQAFSPMMAGSFTRKVHPVAGTYEDAIAVQRQTDGLPPVDRLTVTSIERSRDQRPGLYQGTYRVVASKQLTGKEAEAVAKLWRSLTFNTFNQAMCHEPPYALKFESKGRVLLETTVCWHCHNFTFLDAGGRRAYYGFLANDKAGGTLLDRLKRLVPLPGGD